MVLVLMGLNLDLVLELYQVYLLECSMPKVH